MNWSRWIAGRPAAARRCSSSATDHDGLALHRHRFPGHSPHGMHHRAVVGLLDASRLDTEPQVAARGLQPSGPVGDQFLLRVGVAAVAAAQPGQQRPLGWLELVRRHHCLGDGEFRRRGGRADRPDERLQVGIGEEPLEVLGTWVRRRSQ
jgi:hypothetical protein